MIEDIAPAPALAPAPHGDSEQDRKPKVLLLGEFSSGKSTLANALLGDISSPMRVTATQMPPIEYCAGEGPPIHIASDGTQTPLSPDALGEVPVEGTRAIRIFHTAKLLDQVDLIDMPGSSDPNMAPDIWDSLLPTADIVLWCSPATQAWRQSEAALWDSAPERLFKTSLLLLTRSDKIQSPQDHARLLGRVRRETQGLFRRVLPIAPIFALQDAPDQQDASGLPEVTAELHQIIGDLTGLPPQPSDDLARSNSPGHDIHMKGATVAEAASPAQNQAEEPPKVLPRRIVRPGARRGGRALQL